MTHLNPMLSRQAFTQKKRLDPERSAMAMHAANLLDEPLVCFGVIHRRLLRTRGPVLAPGHEK